MRTLLIALLTALAGGVCAVIGGDWATRAHHVSNMEGGRAMLVLYAIAPAGALVGLLAGIVAAKSLPGTGFAGFIRAQGVALLVIGSLSVLVFGFALWRAPRAPELEGKNLNLELEVRLPPGHPAPDSSAFSVLLTSQGFGDDRHNAELRFDAMSTSEGRLVIPGTAFLYTATRRRFLVVNDTSDQHYWFDLPLRAKPRKQDEVWTDWWPQPGRSATADIRGNGGFQIRYRVQPVPPA